MSFFDDDEPIRASRTRPAAPRRPPAGGGGGGGSRGGRRPPPSRSQDPAAVRQRQLVLAGISVVVFIVLVLGVNSCRTSHRNNALKGYNRDVTKIATASDRVGTDFFQAMSSASSSDAPDVRINQLRQDASNLVSEAKGLDVPNQMDHAQAALELALNFRAEGLRKIAAKIPDAVVQDRSNAASAEDAASQIAGQMQQFVASDVIWSQRVTPLIKQALADADIDGQPVSGSKFIRSFGWLTTDGVAGQLGTPRANGGTGSDPNPAPGTHGHGLTSVSVGGKSLTAGTGAVTDIATSPTPVFAVQFENQGENDETDVAVTVKVTGGGRTPVTQRKTVAMTKAGTSATVDVPLGVKPAPGAATVSVTVAKVPGEMNTDNNKQTYTVLFQS